MKRNSKPSTVATVQTLPVPATFGPPTPVGIAIKNAIKREFERKQEETARVKSHLINAIATDAVAGIGRYAEDAIKAETEHVLMCQIVRHVETELRDTADFPAFYGMLLQFKAVQLSQALESFDSSHSTCPWTNLTKQVQQHTQLQPHRDHLFGSIYTRLEQAARKAANA